MTKENADSHNANRSYHFDFVNVATFAFPERNSPGFGSSLPAHEAKDEVQS
jgi:hypothetical protein